MDEERFVAALYRVLLLREPDRVGLSAHVDALKNGKTPEHVARLFVKSPEFMAKFSRPANISPLDQAPPMRVDVDLTAEQDRALWDHVAQAWKNLGTTEPYWSVLTDPRWKASQMTEAEILDAFYETGRLTLARLDRWLARNGVSLHKDITCAEYGCGVGRCTIWLAKRFGRVLAFDISEPHLSLARARAEAEGLNNIEFVHVKSKRDLLRMRGIDFFFSVIVLQHNPPPLILSILSHAFKGLSLGGIAYYQVPTYSLAYSFNLEDYLGRLTDRGMEMHFVPQRAIFDLTAKYHLQPLEVMPDGMIGNNERWVSTSFLMAKRGDLPVPAGVESPAEAAFFAKSSADTR
jgi:2-polyprenyl-3-methyl-5-hydroxy-6-metoxy-1,4-benzoquinol methylase